MNNLIEEEFKFNPRNERVKYNYMISYKREKEADAKTCKDVLKHLREYEELNDFSDFIIINDYTVDNYVKNLLDKDISLSYVEHNLNKVKEFFLWLREQERNFKKINYSTIRLLRLTRNQRRQARATEYQECYSLDEIYETIRNMPDKTYIDRRDKAMISLQSICGLRVSELKTIRMKNVKQCKETKRWLIHINPKDISVKFCKEREAYFQPSPDDIKENIIKWFNELKDLGFKGKDPLFPKITNEFNQMNLLKPKISKEMLKSNSSLASIFKRAFERAGFEYLRIHSFRHTLVRQAEKKTPEYLNAVRLSLGHSHINTTLQSYGEISPMARAKIFNENEK